jgi:peroxiredoxin (alkyl hydroperoxide reductase subunit C)
MKTTEEKEQRVLSVGDSAPDFTLPTHNEGELNLAWYQGRKNVVLAFYPADWTPVCANQIPGYQSEIETFERHNCQLLAISVDSIPSHMAWAKSLGGLSFPLMSDFWPHGDVARKYGVLTKKGYCERVVFLIDQKGIIRFIDHVPIAELPDNRRLFEELVKLSD